MAGIGTFFDGQRSTANKTFWQIENRELFYVLEMSDGQAIDYGSDIGIDPKIVSGDSIIYIEPNEYTGLWTRENSGLDQAVRRVVRNRRFMSNLPSDNDSLMAWLRELATQTRIPVRRDANELLPGSVSSLKRFSPEVREWLLDDPNRLKELGDNGFENFVVDILRDMGYAVRIVSPTTRKDGGVDIAAWPISGVPYLFAVQVKHHHTAKKTSASDVRDFAGTLDRNPVFRFGLLITNSSFTDDVIHFQEPLSSKLRLRDQDDIRRWLSGDLSGNSEWSDIPDEISLGLNISFPVQAEAPRSDDPFWKFQSSRTAACVEAPLRAMLRPME